MIKAIWCMLFHRVFWRKDVEYESITVPNRLIKVFYCTKCGARHYTNTDKLKESVGGLSQ